MANELQNILDEIQLDKNTNLLPENLKQNVTCLGVNGTLKTPIPIFEITDITEVNTGYTRYSDQASNGQLSYVGNYFCYTKYASSTDNYVTYVGRINSDGTCNVYYTYTGAFYGGIIDVINNYIYLRVHFGNNTYVSTITIYRISCDGGDIEKYWNFSNPNGTCPAQYIMCFDRSAITVNYSHILFLDLINKKIVKNITYDRGAKINKFSMLITVDNVNSQVSYLDIETIKTYIGSVNFINNSLTKIMIDNNLYYLNSDRSVGDLIKSNIFEDYDIKSHTLRHLSGNYYYDFHYGVNGANSLVLFDENTNKFIYQRTLNNLVTMSHHYPTYLNNAGKICYLNYAENQQEILGYTINNEDLYKIIDKNIHSNKILAGVEVYDNKRNTVIGSMSNNGELNYTPNTTDQTIPLGYTSGGTVQGDANLLSENIKAGVTIFGITGTYTGEQVTE